MKKYRLLATPRPHVDESPASILIRAAQGNRYENVHQLVAVTKLNVKQACLDLLINYLDRFLKLAAALYLQCIAPEEVLERQGPTMRALRRFLLHFFPSTFFRQDGTAFCPACLHEKDYLRKIWMFKPYATCHIHNLLIQTNCPHCLAEMKISRGVVRVCSQCECDITQVSNQETPNVVSTWVKCFVSEQDQGTGEFTKVFSWAKSILGPDGNPQDDSAGAAITYQYFNNRDNFQQSLIDFMSFDNRHPRLKLLPLLLDADSLSKIAADLLDQRYKDVPYSEHDLSSQLSLTDASAFLSVSPTTMTKLLNRNKARPPGREGTISLGELISVLQIDGKRKEAIKDQNTNALLTINQVAEHLHVHPEIVRSVQKAGYLTFERVVVAGSLKYMTTQDDLVTFCADYVLVGTLAKKLGVNSTDLTAKLKAIDIFPVATPKNSVLKTCMFAANNVCNLTPEVILAIENCPTNAGRKHKETVILSTPIDTQNVSIIEVTSRLNISIQQAKTLIQKEILERTLDPRNGVFATRSSMENLIQYLENKDYISIDAAAHDLKITKTLLKREWISTGMVEHKNLIFWELVKASDIKNIQDIKSQYVNGTEAGEILGSHRTHATNLYKRGVISRHYFDKEKKIPLYKRADILLLKAV